MTVEVYIVPLMCLIAVLPLQVRFRSDAVLQLAESSCKESVASRNTGSKSVPSYTHAEGPQHLLRGAGRSLCMSTKSHT